MHKTAERSNSRSSRPRTRRWLRTVLAVLVGAALAGAARASQTPDRVLVAADWDGDTSAVPLAAGFVNPSSTTSGFDRDRKIVWAPVPDAEGYRLVVGTAAGASDVLDSGVLTGTSFEMPANISTRHTLYARLYTKVGGVWRADDASRRVTEITFTVPPPEPLIAATAERPNE